MPVVSNPLAMGTAYGVGDENIGFDINLEIPCAISIANPLEQLISTLPITRHSVAHENHPDRACEHAVTFGAGQIVDFTESGVEVAKVREIARKIIVPMPSALPVKSEAGAWVQPAAINCWTSGIVSTV